MKINDLVHPYDTDPKPVNETRLYDALAFKAPPKKIVKKPNNLVTLAEIAAVQPKIPPTDMIKVTDAKPKYMGYAHYQLVRKKFVAAPIPFYCLELRKIN